MKATYRQLLRLEIFLINLPQQNKGEERKIEYLINQSILPKILNSDDWFPPKKDVIDFVNESVFISQDFNIDINGNKDWIIEIDRGAFIKGVELSQITVLALNFNKHLVDYYSEYRQSKTITRKLFGLNISFYYDVHQDDILVEIK